MTRGRRQAKWLRWAMVTAAALAWAFWLAWAFGPALGWHEYYIQMSPLYVFSMFIDWFDFRGLPQSSELASASFLTLATLFLLQWLFLLPRRGWRFKLHKTGRPMRVSVTIAALMAGLLSMGLIASLLELTTLWGPLMENLPGPHGLWYLGLGSLAVLWTVWGVVFFYYWKSGDRYTRLSGLIRGLIAGSFLELFVSAPVYAFGKDPDDCYCARGSYTGLVLGTTVLAWAFGPGVVLLFMREKYRITRAEPVCPACGYGMSGSLAAGKTQCPECGAKMRM